MEKIKSCRVCGSDDLVEILDFGEQPFANSLLRNPDEHENMYPLSISWCSNCSLVQLNHTAEPTDLFSDYVWVTSTSKTARIHSEILCNEVLYKRQNSNRNFVLEVASNDGTFLLPFAQKGHKVLGVDPAENIVEMAIANGVPSKCKFFGVKAAEEIVGEFDRADILMARNVLPHVANLHDFVEGLSICLNEDGLLVVEFHYAKIICEELHYDSIYHEHLCYFTLKSIEKLLNQFGLFVVDIGESPISGGSLILYITKKPVNEAQSVQTYRDLERKTGINELDCWESFARRSYSHRDQLLTTLTGIIHKSGPIAGYGASARSSTLLNFCGIDTRFVSLIADQNPLKHKLYTAGTHIPIDSPETVMGTNPSQVLILAWNFADEIMAILADRFSFAGNCVIPLPNVIRIQPIGG